ncbi:hypothetical protein HRI_002326000 [Hibiscus trionum]|uniref:Peptidase A2 domain-containing protein n=1 Tax=Hibiscus trionum TaxID=183268 RepID=A0A9W7M1Z7_HIBTR|nr:hypothetical protein HRI_002326000 [Hibiscus trionum]
MGSIRFLCALTSQLERKRTESERGLMYVDIVLNGKPTKALVDTNVTDTFISPKETNRCNLKVTKDGKWMKTVNSAALVMYGSARNVMTKVGPWEENIDYTVATIDYYDVVLGLDFMVSSQAILAPSQGCLLFQGDHPMAVAVTIIHRDKGRTLATIQVDQGVQDYTVDKTSTNWVGENVVAIPFLRPQQCSCVGINHGRGLKAW